MSWFWVNAGKPMNTELQVADCVKEQSFTGQSWPNNGLMLHNRLAVTSKSITKVLNEINIFLFLVVWNSDIFGLADPFGALGGFESAHVLSKVLEIELLLHTQR